MTEEDARRVALLKGFEAPLTAPWTDGDAQWASAEARRELGESATVDAFLAARARLGCERLQQRTPALRHVLQRSHVARGAWLLTAIVVAAGLLGYGLGAASIGPDGRLHLMAPPLGGLLVWNTVVIGISVLGLVWTAVKAASGSPRGQARGAPSALANWLAAGLQRAPPVLQGARVDASASNGSEVGAAIARGLAWSAQWSAARVHTHITTAMHLGAAGLVLGALGALYVRGLGEAFYAGWDSTFLSATQAHALVVAVLGPASQAVQIALPVVAEFEGLRLSTGPGAPAAPWIHLWSVTLLFAIVLPRLLLAAASWLKGRRDAEQVRLPSGDAYLSRLMAQQGQQAIDLVALPYAHRPEASLAGWLTQALQRRLGPRCQVRVLAPTFEGDEEKVQRPPPGPGPTAGTSLQRVAVLVLLAATPERETHGRFVQAVSSVAAGPADQRAPVILVVNEAGFGARLSASDAESRRRHRRAAWRELAHELGVPVLFVDPSQVEAPGKARDEADDERAAVLSVS